ncbi:MAG: MBL fold metallo-hydrolase [Muribaculaceae bacterium]|nr:MBL fold metallo-hydrolase [Muribaculaceae bacterium]
MKLYFLGTGTSTGVPQIGCECEVCTSQDPRDRRMRTSAIVEHDGKRLLIDVGPDFYHQILKAGAPSLEALIVTHSHYDHVGGIDDLRPYCAVSPNHHFPVYCQADVDTDLRSRVPYCFAEHPYPGVPTFTVNDIKPYESFRVGPFNILPLEIIHYKLHILGFKINNLAYITDAKTVPEATIDAIKGIDTLVINSLRKREHMSHLSLHESLEIIDRVKPRMAWLTHLSHQMGLHPKVESELPPNVRIAYDGLCIEIPD